MIGRWRYGTGFAGSERYVSAAAFPCSVGGENDSVLFAWKYSRLGDAPARSGQLSHFRQTFEPASNVVASGKSSLPMPLSQ